jgi:alpha-glucosidase (family GH31 glycosyl hydrolase)
MRRVTKRAQPVRRRRTAAAVLVAAAVLGCAGSGPRAPGAAGGTAGVPDGATGGAGGAGGAAPIACSGRAVPVPAAERVANGNPVLPPKWAFGVLYGSYFDQAPVPGSPGDILAAMTRLRAEYGGDLMWIDSSWLSSTYSGNTGARYICFQFDPNTFPDPAAMIATMHANHFHFGVWEWPWVDQDCPLFAYGAANHLFVESAGAVVNAGGWHGNTFTGAFDYRKPAAVAWWTENNQPLIDWGLDFMKLDTSGDPPDGIDADQYRARYHQAAYEATAAWSASTDSSAILNGGRGFILAHTNTSTANDQTPGMWTGDSVASWDGLRAEMQLAAALNTKNSAAYWAGDTGGYVDTPTDELYIRWLEYTAFTPLQEFFGAKDRSTGNRFPWNFSADAQRIFQQYTQLRYRLLPFRYSNALAAYVEQPVKYPVQWIGDTQLVVGGGASALLIQPVTVAGATTASVALPAGARWIHTWSGGVFDGGQTVTVPAPLDQEPIFVRAGSIIPMGPPERWVDETPADPLTLDIYPAGSTSYTLYEDDGISQGYMGGAYAATVFTSDDSGGAPVIGIAAQATKRYPFAGQLCSRTYVLKINGQAAPPAAVSRDDRPVPAVDSQAAFDAAAEAWWHDPGAGIVWVKLTLSSLAATEVALR